MDKYISIKKCCICCITWGIVLLLLIVVFCITINGVHNYLNWVYSKYATETISVVIPNPIADSIPVDNIHNYDVVTKFISSGGGVGVGIGLPQIVLKSVKEFKALIPPDARIYTYIRNERWYIERWYVTIVDTKVFSTSIIVKCPGLRDLCIGYVDSYNTESVIFKYYVHDKKKGG